MAEAGDALEPPPRRPQTKTELFRVFTRLALQGFGGVLPIAHRELVEREHWLSPAQFVELLALGQVLPGPNIVNMAIIFGDRAFGWRGALAAVAGLLTVPMVIVLAIATLYTQVAEHPLAVGALRGMGVVSAGLVVAMAFKLRPVLARNPLGQPAGYAIAGLTLALIGALRWPLVAVVLGLGSTSMGLAWWRIRREDNAS